MNLGTAQVIRADARNLPLADNTVDLVVTSPPYFALRSYQDGGEHYAGQIGSEPTPAEFVAALLEVTRECVRVLKPSGSLWVNLGDKYSQRVAVRPSSHQDGLFPDREDLPKDWKRDKERGLTRMPYQNIIDPASGNYVREKSLMGLPWRYALACIDDLGLILRAEVIWSKPNGLPESVTDRVRRSHEQWFHFTLSPRYFSAVDEIRERHETGPRYDQKATGRVIPGLPAQSNLGAGGSHLTEANYNPLGKLPGSVWTVPTEPLRVPDHLGIDHFAAFPTEWPKRIIRGWSPAGVCVECWEGRRPVVNVTPVESKPFAIQQHERSPLSGGTRNQGLGYSAAERDRTITGYTCACITSWETADNSGVCRACHSPSDWADGCSDCGYVVDIPPTAPAVVLDPFGGTGTTAMVAKALGRHGISVDMSADYCRLAEWRTNDRDQLAKVLGIEKAGPVDDDQLDLFGESA